MFSFSKKNLGILIFVIGFLLYVPSLGNGFVWDDEGQVVNNTMIQNFANIPKFFMGSTFYTGGSGSLGGIYYKPMMSLFFSLFYILSGGKAFLFHFFQIIIHCINAYLIFWVFNKMFEFSKSKYLNILSFFLSLIFLVHPLNTETVVYVSALQDTLYFLFGMLAFYFLIEKKNKKNQLFLVGLMLFFSILSKETGMIFWIMIFFWTLIFEKREFLLKILNVLFLNTVVYFILRMGIAGVKGTDGELSPIMRVGFFVRMMTIPKVIFYYISNFFWPKNLAISQHWVVTQMNFAEFWLPLFFDILFLGIILGGIFYIKKEKKYFKLTLFFLLGFCFSLGLHFHLVPLDMTVADRWFYLSFFNLIGILGVFLMYFLNRIKNKRLFLGIGIVLVLALSVRTANRELNWKDGLTLFSHDQKISHDAFDLENNLGVALYRNGQYEEAKKHFEKSIELAPYWWSNYNNLGAYYQKKKDSEKAKELYLKAISNSDYFLAYENYAKILLVQEKYEEAKEFLEKEALPRFPYNELLRNYYVFAVEEMGSLD